MHVNTTEGVKKDPLGEKITNLKLNVEKLNDEEIKNILANDSISKEDKYKLLGVPNMDQFFQNIYDKEGRIIQKTKDIGDLNLKEILNGEDLVGKTILDLGANCGKYCFESIFMGAGKAVGVDITDNITKFVGHLGLESEVEYIRSDLLTYTPSEDIDITYLFDLMCYLTEEDTLMILERMVSYTKGKVYIVDLFSNDYSKFYKVMKFIRGNKLTHDVRTTYKNTSSELQYKVIEIGGTKVG